jgi:hypothetical protein
MKNMLLSFFAPKLQSYNVLTSIPFEFSKDSLMVEFKVGAYSKDEANSVAKQIIDDFNQKEMADVQLDKLWKISSKLSFRSRIDKTPVSFYELLGEKTSVLDILKGKCKISELELKSLFQKNAHSLLKQENEYVLRTESRNKLPI